jgi:MFS family permease
MKKNSQILTLLFLGTLMGALDISIVGPAIPAISQTLGLDEKSLAWIFSIYVLFNLIGLAPMARLSDLYGRRAIYTISIAIFGIGSLMVSMAHSLPLLLVGRAVQGFGASGIFPVASATIGDIYPVEKQGRALGLIGAVFGIAFILGPIIAGILLKFFAWNVLFIINLPISIVLIVQSLRTLPKVKAKVYQGFDFAGTFLLTIVLVAFTLSINLPKIIDNVPFIRFGLPLIAAVGLVVLIIVESRIASPVVKIIYLKKKQIALVGLIAITTGFIQASFVFFPKMAVASFGVTNSNASFMLIPLVIATAIGSPLGGRMLDKFGPRPIIFTGISLSSLGLLIMSFAASGKFVFYLAGIIIGFGLSFLVGSSLRFIILNETPRDERASAQGILTIFISSGQIVGSVIIASLAALSGGTIGFSRAFLFIGACALIIVPLSLMLRNSYSSAN